MTTKTITLYEVTVWNNTNGEVEQYLNEATEQELDDIIEYYEDEPWFQVVIDREWDDLLDEDYQEG